MPCLEDRRHEDSLQVNYKERRPAHAMTNLGGVEVEVQSCLTSALYVPERYQSQAPAVLSPENMRMCGPYSQSGLLV